MGVNKYRLDHEEPVEVRSIDNTKVREEQIQRLEELRSKRDNTKVPAWKEHGVRIERSFSLALDGNMTLRIFE